MTTTHVYSQTNQLKMTKMNVIYQHFQRVNVKSRVADFVTLCCRHSGQGTIEVAYCLSQFIAGRPLRCGGELVLHEIVV